MWNLHGMVYDVTGKCLVSRLWLSLHNWSIWVEGAAAWVFIRCKDEWIRRHDIFLEEMLIKNKSQGNQQQRLELFFFDYM